MSDKSSNGHSQSKSQTAMPPMMPLGFDALMEMNRPALTAMAQMNGKVYDNLATLNKNWAAFVNRRLKEDLAMPQQLAGCKTVQDLYGVYSEFFQTAVEHYKSEFEEISKLGKALAEETAQAVQSGTEDVVRSVADKARSKAA